MSKVPVITAPCPLRWKSMPRLGVDYCGQCRKRVHNLDGMSDLERQNVFASCSGEVCVAYSVKRAPKMVALSAAAMGVVASVAVLAQEVTMNTPMSPHCDSLELVDVIVGGTTAGKDQQWIDASEATLPDKKELPDIEANDWLPSPTAG